MPPSLDGERSTSCRRSGVGAGAAAAAVQRDLRSGRQPCRRRAGKQLGRAAVGVMPGANRCVVRGAHMCVAWVDAVYAPFVFC